MGFRNQFEMASQKLVEYTGNSPGLLAMSLMGQYGGANRGPMGNQIMHAPTTPNQGTPDGVGGPRGMTRTQYRKQGPSSGQSRNALAAKMIVSAGNQNQRTYR
jgi:hypothetical protein